jgi:hypothetical protein
MAGELTQFDDPQLKAALQRVRGSHKARPELVDSVRQGLAAAMAETDEKVPAPIPIRPAVSRGWVFGRRLAIAASILLAFGLGMAFQQVRHEAHEREEYVEANRDLFREMVAAHTGADAATASAQPLNAGESPASLRDQAVAKLGRFVPLADLAAQGWSLRSAALRQFHASPAASFVFARGGRQITVLSLPSNLYAFAREGQTYETTMDGHPISGFVAKGGVHCVIGDASAPLSDVTSVSELLRQSK